MTSKTIPSVSLLASMKNPFVLSFEDTLREFHLNGLGSSKLYFYLQHPY